MVAVVRFDRVRQRVSGKVCADARLYVSKQTDVPRVADRVCTNSESTSIKTIKLLFDGRLIAEQLVLVNQFESTCKEVFASYWQDRLCEVRIQVMQTCGIVGASPNQARRPTISTNRSRVVYRRSRWDWSPGSSASG